MAKKRKIKIIDNKRGLMQTLATPLQTVMDGETRRPIIDIIAKSAVNKIPFEGILLTAESSNEQHTNIISHSTGRLCLAYLYGPDGSRKYYIKYVYTDVDRTYFTTLTFSAMTSYKTAIGLDICELTDGNIGIVFIEDNTTTNNYILKQKIVNVTGTEISSTTIDSWSRTIYTSGPSVCREHGSDNYIIAYSKNVGGNYYIHKHTSNDFTTWDAATSLVIGELTLTQKIFDPFIYSADASDDNLFLYFAVVENVGPNGEILSNIYYSLSTDGGNSWADAVKITTYDSYGAIGEHPTFCEKEENSGYLAFNEKRSSQTMDYTSIGWPDYSGIRGNGSDPSNMHFDSVNRKLYCVNAYKGVGTKALQSVVKIDVDTWEVDNYWTTSSIPALDDYWDNVHLWYKLDRGSGKYVPLSVMGGYFCQLINGETDTITTYAFQDIPAYEITANVTGWDDSYGSIISTFIDETNNRIWFLFVNSSIYDSKIQIGYISLTDSGPTYTFVKVITDTDFTQTEIYPSNDCNFKIYPDSDLIVLSFYYYSSSSDWQRPLCVYNIITGSRIKKYIKETYSSFPLHGIRGAIYKDGKIYGNIYYYDLYGQENMRGLFEVDITTDIICHHRPSFASVNNYDFYDIVATNNDELLITSTIYGCVKFNLLSETWTTYNNTTIPGLTPKNSDKFYLIDYDELNDFIFCGVGTEYVYPWAGYVMFSGEGYFLQTQYATATKVIDWAFGEVNSLVQGLSDYDSAIVCDPSTLKLYAFWTNETTDDELSIKWDKDEGEFSLNDYLVRGRGIVVSRSIDGSNNTVSLTVSDGHLFDPFNVASVLKSVLDKGKLLVVKFGEKIGVVEYWQTIGTFYITDRKMSGYKKGEYPTLTIKGEDYRYIWKDKEIVATQFYDSGKPEEVLTDVISDYTPLETTDIDIVAFDNSVVLNVQWTDTTLLDCVQQIHDRFGYFLKVTNINKITNKKISIDNEIDHIYSNSNQILSMNIDDSFSDFTNKITVEGQERDFIETLYDEEMVGSLNGTVGWWGYKNSFDVYYSKDKSRRCRNPRLKVVESVTSIGFKLGGKITESIMDTDEKYCTVNVRAPSLIGPLLGFIATKLGAGKIGDACPQKWTRPVGTSITNVASIGIMVILGATGNFQYEIYANPVGEVKRSVEASVEDFVFQNKINNVVEKRFEDPFCYSKPECAKRAQKELDVIMAQRNRIRIEKITHLQDEEGDTIDFLHPVSEQVLKIFVTDLIRTYTIPKLDQINETISCIDDIEGWVIE